MELFTTFYNYSYDKQEFDDEQQWLLEYYLHGDSKKRPTARHIEIFKAAYQFGFEVGAHHGARKIQQAIRENARKLDALCKVAIEELGVGTDELPIFDRDGFRPALVRTG